ncbi:hypothetical protein OMAG_002590 [Candidatus Omnitrophus magneticus]|uniref:Uncharacterized protein n=1 Tax=Candidatus Omnitrophus magneticus TaxID=1609969 RepID=A0A0F0CQ35_9BACT|nr:hypothetical protein OMAG_002590 [Candidatus Omnitrophus magneticus]
MNATDMVGDLIFQPKNTKTKQPSQKIKNRQEILLLPIFFKKP